MRGIAGVIQLRPTGPAAADALAALLTGVPVHAARAELGRAETAAAAFARFATRILPQDFHDRQPLTLPDGGLLATTALLRNRAALAAEFGWTSEIAATRAESDFVAAAYQRWGEECPRHLEGAFALAVWQPARRRLFCATDLVASTPLYYSHQDGRFAFASTLNALLALPGVDRRLHRPAFANLVALIPTDDEQTLYTGVRRLRGAHALALDESGARQWRYVAVAAPPVLTLASDADYAAAMREQLRAAVQRSLRPMPGQVGLLLSGGLDSSSVAAVAGRLLAEQGRRLQCIHLLPRGDDRYRLPHTVLDETSYVRQLEAHSPHIDFHYVETTSRPAERAAWDDYFATHRAPFPSLLATETSLDPLLDRLDVRLLLDGLGGNHVVSLEALPSGYLAHLALTMRWRDWWRETRAHSRLHDRPWRWLVRHTAINPWKLRLRGRAHPSVFRGSTMQLLHPEFRRTSGVDERKRAARERWFGPPVDLRQRLTATVHEWVTHAILPPPSVCPPTPLRRLSSHPLYDRHLSAFCLSLPFDQQVRDGWDRRLLREAMRGWLPESVRLRTTRGLLQPEFQSNFTRAEPLLRAEMSVLGSSALERELLDLSALRALWHQQQVAPPSLARELQLMSGLSAAAFLRWHEGHGGT